MLANRDKRRSKQNIRIEVTLTDGKLSYTRAHPSSSSSLETSSSLTAKAARALPAGGFGFLLDVALVDVCIAAAASLSFFVVRFAFLAAVASDLDAGFLAAGFLGALSLPEALSEAARLEVGFVFDPFSRLEEVSAVTSSDFRLGSCDCLLGGIVVSKKIALATH